MDKSGKKDVIPLKVRLHEIEEILDKADPEKDRSVIISKREEVICLLYHKHYYPTLLQRVRYAKINNSVSDAQDVFQNCIIKFTDWFNEKYLGIKTAQSDAVKESDQQAEIDEKEAAKELAEVFDPEGKEKTEDVRKESGNHNHMYYYLHQLLRTRAIDEYRKAHRKQTQSLEGMLKDENGKQSDHNTVLSAGEQYQTEQSLIHWETVNAQYDTMLIDIISQIISLYREMKQRKNSRKWLMMCRIFFSRDVIKVVHNFDTMPAFEHGQEIGKNTKEPFVNFCLQKHVSYEEDGKYVLGGILMNPYKPYLDLITDKARLELQNSDSIVNMDEKGIPNTVIEGYFEKCCNTTFAESNITYYKKVYDNKCKKHGVETAAAAE